MLGKVPDEDLELVSVSVCEVPDEDLELVSVSVC